MTTTAPTRIGSALLIAVLWTYVAVVAAAVLILVVGLVALAALGVMWVLRRDVAILDGAMRSAKVAVWVVGPLAGAAAVWSAAYASTKWGSWPRAVVGAFAGVAVGTGLLLLDSSGFLAGGLALGWAVAMPSQRADRIAARALPLLLVALVAPNMADIAPVVRAVILAMSPVVAAGAVGLGEGAWLAVAGRRMSG